MDLPHNFTINCKFAVGHSLNVSGKKGEEFVFGAKEAGQDKVQQRPNICRIVADRRAGN